MNKTYVSYDIAEKHIKEGYVLLFRGSSWISSMIQKASDGPYSHVGLATWTNGVHSPAILECVEFREWYGGRTVNLRNYVNQNPGMIDVFAPVKTIYTYHYDPELNIVNKKFHKFEGKAITNAMRKSTGLPYGWNRIWWLAKFHLPLLRTITRDSSYDDTHSTELIYPVCSTAIAYNFSKYYVDLTKFRSDERTEPADIARSPILNYLMTLTT